MLFNATKRAAVAALVLMFVGMSFAQEEAQETKSSSSSSSSANLGFKKGDPAFDIDFLLGGRHRGIGAHVGLDGALNNFISLGWDVEFDVWKPHERVLGIRVDYGWYNVMRIVPNIRANFHVFGIPPLEAKGVGKRHDVYAGLKMGARIPIFIEKDKNSGYGGWGWGWGYTGTDNKKAMKEHYKYAFGSSAGGFNFDWSIGYRFYPKGEKFHVHAEWGRMGLALGVGF
jgi:hypothetical protein